MSLPLLMSLYIWLGFDPELIEIRGKTLINITDAGSGLRAVLVSLFFSRRPFVPQFS